jgi:hypothetical protein
MQNFIPAQTQLLIPAAGFVVHAFPIPVLIFVEAINSSINTLAAFNVLKTISSTIVSFVTESNNI